jgi:hypothetical protein
MLCLSQVAVPCYISAWSSPCAMHPLSIAAKATTLTTNHYFPTLNCCYCSIHILLWRLGVFPCKVPSSGNALLTTKRSSDHSEGHQVSGVAAAACTGEYPGLLSTMVASRHHGSYGSLLKGGADLYSNKPFILICRACSVY